MKVKRLKEILESVDPEREVYVWNNVAERYEEATYAEEELLFKIEDGERVYDEDEEPIMFTAFIIGN